MDIKLLPEHLINQIKAGEVVERPSSLLKELIENSIDAMASKIHIEIINSGLDLIVVKDNGKGMTFEEVPFAFERHTTSKIHDFSDLYKLSTYGFRGEALASISSVSRLHCLTKKSNSDAAEIEIEGGIIKSHLKSHYVSPGTEIRIYDLFFNTPVRLKFLKSQQSEKNALLKIVHSTLLAYPNLELTLKFDDEKLQIFSPCHNIEDRFRQIAPRSADFFNLENDFPPYKLSGLVAQTPKKGHSSKTQFIIVNNRMIQDKSIHQIVINLMRTKWQEKGQGSYLINISVPAHHLDVNVHPNKIAVKFSDEASVHSLLAGAIKQALAQSKQVQESSDQSSRSDDINSRFSSEDFINIERAESKYQEDLRRLDETKWIKFSSPSLIIDLERLFSHFLENLTNLNEIEYTPLLVALPCEATSFNSPYSSLFELESISETKVLIKSVPKDFMNLDYQTLTKDLLSGNYSVSTKFLQTLRPSWINDYISTYSDRTFYRELTNQNVEKLFN